MADLLSTRRAQGSQDLTVEVRDHRNCSVNMNTAARRCIRDYPVGSVPLDSVSLLLYLIDVYDLIYICMLCIVDMLS